MNTKHLFLTISTIVSIQINSVIAQNQTIKGQIVDSNAAMLEFVNIVAFTKDSTFINGATTNERGLFELSVSNQKISYIKCIYLGFQDKVVQVNSNNQVVDLGIIILENSELTLDEVTVIAEKPLVERKIDRLIVNVDKSILSAGNNALDVLERSPGVFVDLNGAVTLRGRSGVNVMINGKQQHLSTDDLNNYLRTLSASDIQKIELISNPSAAFDAEGTAGVINIVLKRDKNFGTNGSFNASYGKGRYSKSSEGISLNNRNRVSSIYATFNHNFDQRFNHLFTIRQYADNGQIASIYDQNAKSVSPTNAFVYNLGADFYVSDNTIAGLNVSGSFSKANQDGNGNAIIYDGENMFDGGFNTDTKATDKRNNFSINGNLRTNFKEDKGDLSFDADYANYKNDAVQSVTTSLFNESNNPDGTNILNGNTDGWLKLYAFKSDLNLNSLNSGKFSMGLKSSFVKNDNDLDFFDDIDGEEIPNDNFSNQFRYKENINAAYVNWNYEHSKWTYQIGLRAEQTNIEGLQLTTSEGFKRNYIQVFPSFFTQFKPNDNYTFGFNAGRRINRPNYNQLNPFKTFVDISTFRAGNPNLTPEFSLNFEASFTYKNWLDTSFSYSNTKDNIIPVLIQDDATRTTGVQLVNIGNYNYYGLNTSITTKPFKNFNNRWNIELFYNEFLGKVSGFDLNEKGFAFRLRSDNSYSFGKGWSSEMNFFYQPTYDYGITRFDPRWKLDVGLQKSILNGNGKIRLVATDLFLRYYPRGSTNFGNINESFRSIRDTRVVTVSLSYNFGNNNIKINNKKEGGAKEEKNRITS